MINVYDVKTEYRNKVIGLDVKEPRISWKIKSDRKNVFQESYHLQISTDEDFSELVWDSGVQKTQQTTHVALKDIHLVSNQRYYIRVKVTDNENNQSVWAEDDYFETGLLTHSEWEAKWITGTENTRGEPVPNFRRQFKLNKPIKRARIYATSLGIYEMYLNNERVGQDYFTPGWTSYTKRLQYQTYDVTDQLKTGENQWNASVGNGWYKGNLGWEDAKELYGDKLALLSELRIEFTDGSSTVIKTDENWHVSQSHIKYSELYHGEKVNFQSAISKWDSVEILDHPKNILVAQENEPVRKIETIEPKERFTTPNGETVLDFGQNMVGWVELDIAGEDGQQISIEHAEVLDKNGNFYTGNLRTAKQKMVYTLKNKEYKNLSPTFSFQGFRYVRLEGFNENQLDLANFRGVVLHSDMEVTGEFETSHELINQLQHNIVWGLKGNFLDVPTDCPQRDERLGWTGDAQMFIRTATYLNNVAPFFTKWLRDLEADQLDDGSVPHVVPNILGIITEAHEKTEQQPYSSAAWGDAAVICPWTLYVAYGDKRILEEQYSSMKNWVEHIKSQGDNPFLWNTGFHFGDWLALDAAEDSYIGATDRSLIATAFYAYSTSLVKKTANVLNQKEDYAYFKSLEEDILKTFTEIFITDDQIVEIPTQTAYLLLLMFDLVENDMKDKTVEALHELLKETDYHLTTGFVGTPYLNHVLTENGLNKVAYTLLFQEDYPSWLYQITKGATTIWEHWDGIKEDGSFWSDDMNSFNHYAYGAIGDWLYRKVAGIELDEEKPGYKEFLIKPYIEDGLDWVKSSLETMHGRIESNWKKEGNKTTLDVVIPANTQGTISLIGAQNKEVFLNGELLEQSNWVLESQETTDSLDISLASGDYTINFE